MTRKTDILLSTAHQVLEDEIRSLQDLNMLLDECFEKTARSEQS
jgi:hypothetical protein